MKLRSFRLRLALISAASAAVGLLVFGGAVAGLWRKHRLSQLDEELIRRGNVLASRVSVQNWERVYESMQTLLGEETIDDHFLAIRSSTGQALRYTSPNWPLDLALHHYPASEETFEWRGSSRDFLRPRTPWRRRPNPNRDPTAQGLDTEPAPRRGLFPRRGPVPTRTLKQPALYEVRLDNQLWRLGVFGNPQNDVLLAVHLGELQRELKSMFLTFATASIASLTLIALGAWLISRKALSPIEALTRATEKVSASDLSQRLELPHADREFRPLIQVYNRMMERLERSFHQATRFSADASHELKTPVAIMKGTLERALREAPEGSKEQAVYTSLLEESDHQQAILQSLLILSQADAGKIAFSQERLSLSELVTQALDDAEMMAEDNRLSLESDIAPHIEVTGDPSLLQQILHNLLSNAVKYNRLDGWLKLELREEADAAVLRVCNSGDPIPETAQPHLFERFYRVEPSRSDRRLGVGLGLSLSLELVKVHRGTLSLMQSNAEGTVFEMRLPLAAPSTEASFEGR